MTIIVKTPIDLQALLAKMVAANKADLSMNVWDKEIKTVEEAIATIEAIRSLSSHKEN